MTLVVVKCIKSYELSSNNRKTVGAGVEPTEKCWQHKNLVTQPVPKILKETHGVGALKFTSHRYSRETSLEWEDEEKSWWSSRTSLEKKLIVMIAVIGVASAGFFIYTAIKQKDTVEICETSGCLLAGAEIISHVNLELDPCGNFFKFVCGKFIESTTTDDVVSLPRPKVKEMTERQIKELFEEPANADDHELIKVQKLLLKACMNETAIEEQSLDTFMDVLEDLNGMPVIVGYHWKARLFDWQDMIYELRQRGYIYDMLLRIDWLVDHDDADKGIIEITEPFVKSLPEEHRELYKKYMIDVVVALGARRDLATIEMELVLEFMEKLKKIVDDSISRRLAEVNANFTEAIKMRRFTVEEFQFIHEDLEWIDFINTMISPFASITEKDYAIFPDLGFLFEFFNLLKKSPRRIQANYIIWTVLEDVMPYMPKELQQLQANYTCTTGLLPTSEDRLDFCRNVIETSLLPGFMDILYARRYLIDNMKDKVEELFESIKSQLHVDLIDSSWMDEESKQNTLAKLDTLGIAVGFSEDYFNDTIFDKFSFYNYSLNDIENDNFFTLFLKSRKIADDEHYSHFNDIPEINELYNEDIQINSQGNRTIIKIHPRLLQGIYFNEDRPQYINYATIGFLISYHLFTQLENIVFEHNYFGNETLWSKETLTNYQEQLNCFIQELSNFGLNETRSEIEFEIIAEEYILNYVGIQVAYKAYKTWIEENKEESYLPGIDYSPFQLFWISGMIPQCYAEEDQIMLIKNGPLKNNFNFAEDFSCYSELNMNPIEKCELL